MARPGGVKTMQDEIDEGLRDKDGKEFTAEQIEQNKIDAAKKADEENKPAQEETTDTTPADDGAESSGADGGSQQEPPPSQPA